MSASIRALARWAAELQLDQIPPAVLERARLQHLSQAGALWAGRERPLARALVKASSPRGAALRVGGGSAPRQDALRLHSSLIGVMEYGDLMLGGDAGAAAAPAAWAWSRGRSVGDVLRATVAANEVAARIGLAMMLGPTHGLGTGPVYAAAAAVAAGLLEGLEADRLAHVLALALSQVPRSPHTHLVGGGEARGLAAGQAALAGAEALELAQAGVEGPLSLLDPGAGLLEAWSWVPLRNALTGLGSAWLTRTWGPRLVPAGAFCQVPVQAVGEILRRHIKAADKRLRADQVDKIEIRAGAPTWTSEALFERAGAADPTAAVYSTRRSVAALVVASELGPAQTDPAWIEKNAEAIGEVARRVELSHDWSRTYTLLETLVTQLSPLFAGLTREELRQAGAMARATYGSLPAPTLLEAAELLRRRPDQLWEKLARSPSDLSAARLEDWQFRFDVEVKLHTTRGGTWPERRTIPEGSPGWAWEDTVQRVKLKFAQGRDEAAAGAESWLSAGPRDEAEPLVARLLGA